MHGQVVADVIAPVLVRGWHRRGQPDAVHAEPREVVEPVDDAGQVAVAVTVGVLPGPDVELVEDSALPPAPPLGLRVHSPPLLCVPALPIRPSPADTETVNQVIL